jgi:hypothetical protein
VIYKFHETALRGDVWAVQCYERKGMRFVCDVDGGEVFDMCDESWDIFVLEGSGMLSSR